MTLTPFTLTTLLAAASLGLLACAAANAQSSGGDQLVDGIGETSLIARYPLDRDANDRSRDGHHAKVTRGEFVDDRRFRHALSLSGLSGSGVELPTGTADQAETLSVVGWVRPRVATGKASLFDMTPSPSGLTCELADGDIVASARGGLTVRGPAVDLNRWTHVAVVYDAATASLVLYVNGAASGRAEAKAATRPATTPSSRETNARIGDHLDGLFRDVRLYSVALTASRVDGVYRGGSGRASSRQGQAGPTTRETAPVSVEFAGTALISVAHVTATTAVGLLPTLPAMIDGKYANDADGPQLRVIWPSPRSNADVATVGQYTVKGRVPGTRFEPTATVKVVTTDAVPSPRRQLEPFPLGQVVLDRDASGRETPFQRNRQKFLGALAETNPDDFLYMFRDAFGVAQPSGAQPLGVWDSQTTRLRGHATGHYLSALAQAYAGSTDDEKARAAFLQRLNCTVDVLYDLSKRSGYPAQPGGPANADPTAVLPGDGRSDFDSDLSAGHIRTDYWNWGQGFISAYPPDQFILLEHGASYGTGNNQIWAPYYTLHKILAGLLDCYEVAGNTKALDVARGMGLWTYERLKMLPPETRVAMWNRYIAGEYGGMNEVMARLGRLTGDRRFVDAAKLFDNQEFFFGNAAHPGGLAANVDTLRGKHANQHIPQIIGALETFADTGEASYLRVAENFWTIATRSYAYSIGGVAGGLNPNNAECFTAEPDTLWQNGFSEAGQNETCATYNLLKLSRGLFMFRPSDTRYMDYYERALYNDILASVAQHDAGNTYHIPLSPGAKKSFSNADMHGFTCCNGTALESNTKLQDTIYLRTADGSAVYINLFIPSTLRWQERGLSITQQTDFPYADSTRLTVARTSDVAIYVRIPDWATNGVYVSVNGVERPIAAKAGSYFNLGGSWKDGDQITIRMPFAFHLARVMDRPNIASLLYGPIVLAAPEAAARADWRPLQLDPANLAHSITGDPATLHFHAGDVSLQPFFESFARYSVYFDVHTAAGSP